MTKWLCALATGLALYGAAGGALAQSQDRCDASCAGSRFAVCAAVWQRLEEQSKGATNDICDAGRSLYFAGFVDAVMSGGFSGAYPFCPPGNVTYSQSRSVVAKYIREHSESRKMHPIDVAIKAYSEAYPCSARTKKK